jgi:hypothetical protein
MLSPMSFRLPWIRSCDAGPTESVSVPFESVPRNDGLLNGTEKWKSVTRANSKFSVIFVMKRLIST